MNIFSKITKFSKKNFWYRGILKSVSHSEKVAWGTLEMFRAHFDSFVYMFIPIKYQLYDDEKIGELIYFPKIRLSEKWIK